MPCKKELKRLARKILRKDMKDTNGDSEPLWIMQKVKVGSYTVILEIEKKEKES